MGNGVNKTPLVHEPGSLNNMAAAATFAKIVADEHIPASVFNVKGGYNGIYTIPVGGVNTINDVAAPPIVIPDKDQNCSYLMKCFFTYDSALGVGGWLAADNGSHICFLENSLGQTVGEILSGKTYIVDNNFLQNISFSNRSLNFEIDINLTEIIPF